MTLPTMAFTPVNGVRDKTYAPTVPVSEAAFRDEVQGISDQLRDFLNLTLKPLIIASNVPNSAIAGMTSLDVQSALAELKAQLNAAVAGSIPDGSITIAKMTVGTKTDLIGGQIYAYKNIGGGL